MTEIRSNTTQKDNQDDSACKKVEKCYNKVDNNIESEQSQIDQELISFYQVLIAQVKELHSTLPDAMNRIVIEMKREEKPFNPISIYCFITPHVYFYLECDVCLKYRIEYQLYNCPFEMEVKQAMKQIIYHSYCTEVMNMPNYSEFFKEVISSQPDNFKRIL